MMRQRKITFCIVGCVASLLASTTGAVDAVRTEAAQELAEKSQPASGKVTSMVFTKAIVDGKPTNDQKSFENTVDTVYFYTVLEGLKGQTVTHRWSYSGRVIANAAIPVKEDPFSTWSSNKMEPNWTGFWTVEVLNGSNRVIGAGTFEYNHPRNLQMNPDANKAGEDVSDIPGGSGGWGWGRGRGWGW
jgi:hypothetical protein